MLNHRFVSSLLLLFGFVIFLFCFRLVGGRAGIHTLRCSDWMSTMSYVILITVLILILWSTNRIVLIRRTRDFDLVTDLYPPALT